MAIINSVAFFVLFLIFSTRYSWCGEQREFADYVTEAEDTVPGIRASKLTARIYRCQPGLGKYYVGPVSQ